MAIDVKGKQPFIITVEGSDRQGTLYAVPVGVELSCCPAHAFEQAVRRWPYYAIHSSCPWEEVPPKVRLAALRADRMDKPY